jgi:protein-S-isoprenylcysteine O-methyltransferase Ste14
LSPGDLFNSADGDFWLERSMGNDARKTGPLVRVPVPWVFVVAYLVGIGIQTVVPLSAGSAAWLLIAQILGILMLAAGAALAVWAQLIFRREHTTTVPYETTTSLVTRALPGKS